MPVSWNSCRGMIRGCHAISMDMFEAVNKTKDEYGQVKLNIVQRTNLISLRKSIEKMLEATGGDG